MDADLCPVVPSLREPTDEFHIRAGCPGATLGDYWRWSSSNVLDNTERGILAEFLVAHSLSLTHKPRVEWGSYDLITTDSTKIEVKSSAYLQSWRQKTYSTIKFGIARRKYEWDPETGESKENKPPKRNADIYIFCLLKEKDKTIVDPLDTKQWEFYVIPTFRIDEKKGSDKTISLGPLRDLADDPVQYSDLAATVAKVAESIPS